MLNTYVGLLGAAVAIQGAMAQDNALAPNRLTSLDPNHVANSHSQAKSACYQDSQGQILDNGSILKYPCISQLEIDAYCKQPAFEKNREAQKQCFFGPNSTFTQDYEACLACKAYNGQVTQKWLDDQKAFIGNLKTKFVDQNPNNDSFESVYERNKPADPVGPPISPKVKVVDGVADINILSYYENPPKSQQYGVTAPEEQKPAEAEPATAGAGGEASVAAQSPFEIFYPAVVSLQQGDDDQVARGKQNTSSDAATAGGVKGLVWMKMSGSISVSINAAQARAQANSTLNPQDVVKTTGVSVSKNEPLPETAVKIDASSSVWILVKNNVFYDADGCGCFEKSPFNDAQLASPAAEGNGTPTTELIAGSKITIGAPQGSVKCSTGAKGGAKDGNPALTDSAPVGNSAPVDRPVYGSGAPVDGRPAAGRGAPVTNNQAPVVNSPLSKDEVAAKIEAAAKVGIPANEAESLPWCE